jgi:hypothetical protein
MHVGVILLGWREKHAEGMSKLDAGGYACSSTYRNSELPWPWAGIIPIIHLPLPLPAYLNSGDARLW